MLETEQKIHFNNNPFPDATNLGKPQESIKIFNGQEAFVIQAGDIAFKWYASLSGKSVDQLLAYARQVKQDETRFYTVGATKNQVIQTSFFIANGGEDQSAQLYAVQEWITGTAMKSMSVKKILANPTTRESLAEIFLLAAEVYQTYRRKADLTGGDKISIFGRQIPHPVKVINPFFTPNIMITQDGLAVLPDVRCHGDNGKFTNAMIDLHRLISVTTAYLLQK
ncbi:hypothetical protein HGA88_03885 [Candidatus Roizmanbacteria bacterium]|nr:hypothetical protein [Candidatus Roizmanbacteria bacterium]